MKKLLSLILFFKMCSIIEAQELTVKSFSLAQTDLSAQTSPRKDLNGVNCALVKVRLPLQDATFEGGIIKPVTNKSGEYWVYMPKGNSQLTIKHPNYVATDVRFANYGINKLESNRTYVLTVVTSGGNNAQAQKQTLNITYSPSNAVVLIDNEMVKSFNGRTSVSLPIGEHSYIITATGYESEEGTVKLKAAVPSKLNIELTKKQTTDDGANSLTMNTPSTPTKLVGASDEVQSFLEETDFTKMSMDEKTDFLALSIAKLYDIDLGITKFSDIAAKYHTGIQNKDGKGVEIEIQDGTAFKDTNETGVVDLICIHPGKSNVSLPISLFGNVNFQSSYFEWNEWLKSQGFNDHPYKPYFGKQAMITLVNKNCSIIFMFDGKEKNQDTMFSLIVGKIDR